MTQWQERAVERPGTHPAERFGAAGAGADKGGLASPSPGPCGLGKALFQGVSGGRYARLTEGSRRVARKATARQRDRSEATVETEPLLVTVFSPGKPCGSVL